MKTRWTKWVSLQVIRNLEIKLVPEGLLALLGLTAGFPEVPELVDDNEVSTCLMTDDLVVSKNSCGQCSSSFSLYYNATQSIW